MHELDITDDITSFADSRTDAWHQLGQQVNHLMTAEEVIREAQMADWDVRKIPAFGQEPPVLGEDGVTVPPPILASDRFMTVRTNPVNGRTDYLGVVGPVWQPIQNEETAELLDAIVDESGAHFETAGALDGGRRTFVTMKLPSSIELRGHDGTIDRTDLYFAGLNDHTGQNALRGIITPVRIVCGNTETAGLRQAKANFSIRHTLSAATAIGVAREALGLTWRYVEEFEKEVEKLYAQEMTTSEMRTFAGAVMGLDTADTDRQRNSRQVHVSNLMKLWSGAPTITNIAGTKWGAYNTVTEYADHYMPVRKGDGRTSPASLRAARTLTQGSTTQGLKLKAFELLTV